MTKLIFPVAALFALGACQSEPPDQAVEEIVPEEQDGMIDNTMDGMADPETMPETLDTAPSGEQNGDRDEAVVPPQANAVKTERTAPAAAASAAAARPSLIPAKAAATSAASANATAGGRVYAATCVACHGANGKGTIPGVPDLTAANGRLAKSDAVLLRNMINGVQSPGSPMAMPPKGGNPSLTDKDIANTLAYIRKTFGS